MILAHISDLHLDGEPRATKRAERVFAFLDRLHRPVDAILLTGDITDHGTEAEYEQAKALLRERPVLPCPGNHDARGPYRKVLLGEPASEGPVNTVHDLPGARILLADSTVPGRPHGYLDDETLAWLDAGLSGAPAGKPVLVGFHHPPIPLHSPFIDEIRLRGAERLAEVLRRHGNVAAVLCGHAHSAAAGTFAGLPLLVAPGVVSTFRLPWETGTGLDGGQPPALAFHLLDPGGTITTHYRLVV
ncbi:phosphodiesterase [Amycolatopsis rhizosphaerae]|uniref:Phosphodiesterase n=2 Tax=Amycolatopsis rhizosphaerae TaxID=2053003 RepID=A0A558ANJ1_9PSEU|nr:phosphodiesterase [Amycolatopsis rhizosphaerae]TVT25821.1 phosphodiesterase [Amycolatopsis rhizosphaerae]